MEEIAGGFDDSECFKDAYDDVEGLCDETGLAVFSLDLRVSLENEKLQPRSANGGFNVT